MSLGIMFALGALFCWGIGDFLLQRESRLAGTWQTLFYNTFVAVIALTPFVLKDLRALFTPGLLIFFLGIALLNLLVVAFEFEAFRRGKLAVVEPIMSFELPLTVLLGVIVGGELLSLSQGTMIAIVFTGIFLLAYRMDGRHSFWERGALLALVSAIVMAAVNYVTGRASQTVGPVATIWLVDLLLLGASFTILVLRKETHTIIPNFMRHPWSALAMAIFDNAAWLFYAAAAVLIPISIAITISESYIILAILLGVVFNRERMKRHQWLGASFAVVGVLILGAIT